MTTAADGITAPEESRTCPVNCCPACDQQSPVENMHSRATTSVLTAFIVLYRASFIWSCCIFVYPSMNLSSQYFRFRHILLVATVWRSREYISARKILGPAIGLGVYICGISVALVTIPVGTDER